MSSPNCSGIASSPAASIPKGHQLEQQRNHVLAFTAPEQNVQLVRWGHFGTPVMLFPTAGGDAEEAERFHLIGAIAP